MRAPAAALLALVAAALAGCVGDGRHCALITPCFIGYSMFLQPEAFDSNPKSPQRVQQGIARTMNGCLNTAWARMLNSNALECICRARRACLAAGLPKGCAFDDEALETTTSGSLGVVGHCE